MSKSYTFFDTGFHYVVLADLELKDLPASALPSDGIKDLQHHTQPQMSKSSHFIILLSLLYLYTGILKNM